MHRKTWRLISASLACTMPLVIGCGQPTYENAPERVITEEEVRAAQQLPMPESRFIVPEKTKK